MPANGRYTKIFSRILDVTRRVGFKGVGKNAVLKLLEHDAESGYSEIATVPKGWRAEDGDNPAEPFVIEIVESATVTAAMLLRVSAFSVDGLVYKIVGDGRRQPTPMSNNRVWRFFTAQSSAESFND